MNEHQQKMVIRAYNREQVFTFKDFFVHDSAAFGDFDNQRVFGCDATARELVTLGLFEKDPNGYVLTDAGRDMARDLLSDDEPMMAMDKDPRMSDRENELYLMYGKIDDVIFRARKIETDDTDMGRHLNEAVNQLRKALAIVEAQLEQANVNGR